MRTPFVLFGLLCILSFKISIAQTCPAPSDLYVSDLSSCGLTIHWNSSGSVIKYTLKYRLSTSSLWIKTINTHTDTFYHFSGLQPATAYVFQVGAACTNFSSSKKAKLTVTTRGCTTPTSVTLTSVSDGKIKISVSGTCDIDSLHVKYGMLQGSTQIISFPSSLFYTIGGLAADSTYLFQVSTCPIDSNEWTVADTFHVVAYVAPPIPSRNILFIVLDDARYDYYSCNGAPPFFHTPNIDRIANEGVNFKNSFVVTSLCAPSRASIATGLFTTRTGVTLNGMLLDTSFNTIPKFLKNHGYYTALVGKNHGIYLNGKIPEYSFYMSFSDYGKQSGMEFNYNGDTIFINKQQSLTLTDTAIALIQRVNQPFYIYLAYVDPHLPPNPFPSFIGRFDNDTIPWKADTAKYTMNYPSYLYKTKSDLLHGIGLDTTYRHVLEAVAGIDSCIGRVFEALESSGKMDSTLIIFISDNGHMMGAHWQSGKTLPYDPSIRIPIFMRYRDWFAPSSVIQNQMALNLDIAPTIYQFAGLNYPDQLDGISLKQMYDGLASRNEFYYVMLRTGSADPSHRAIRDFHYKYINSSCNSETEELYDMVNDSLELNNLANDHNYDSILGVYRLRLDSMEAAWDDTVPSVIRKCSIANPVYTRESESEIDGDVDATVPAIYPALTSGEIDIYNPWPSAMIELYDGFGRKLDAYETSDSFLNETLPDLPNGMYMLKMTYRGNSFTQKIILQR